MDWILAIFLFFAPADDANDIGPLIEPNGADLGPVIEPNG